MAGLSVVGRNYYGVFPLRGKLLNVREASHKQIMENAEIQNIKKILGLQHGKQYDSVKSLRYGHLMIMTDQVILLMKLILREGNIYACLLRHIVVKLKLMCLCRIMMVHTLKGY